MKKASLALGSEGLLIIWLSIIFVSKKRYPTITTEDGTDLFKDLAFTEESVESAQIQKDVNAHLRLLIEKLPEKQKEVLLMRHFSEMSFQEIAEETGVSINTALGRMRYALINIRKMYNQTNQVRL